VGTASCYGMDGLGLTLPLAQWGEGFFQGCKTAEGSHHDLS